jgi:histidyl-tRNA synthetase
VERILLASGLEPEASATDVFVAYADEALSREAFKVMRKLRGQGVSANVEQAGRSLKGQFKHADRLGARHVVIVGHDGLEVKDMSTGEQRPVASPDEVLEAVR